METLYDAMKVLLATNFAFYLKLHFFHWNIEGADFPQYHKFFNDLYEEVFDAVDGIAEQIRSIGSYAPGSFGRYAELSQIEDQIEVLPPDQMIAMALADNQKVIDCLTVACDEAENAKAYGLVNFLQGRLEIHAKHGWMLRATSK